MKTMLLLWTALAVPSFAVASPAPLPAQASEGRQDEDKKKFEEFKKESLRKEDAGTFRKIAWQKDMAAALEKAQADGKPILVFLVVGHRAEKDAAEC
jgi:hypothetical protein